MAIGGFNGEGGNISLATFEAYVAKGDIHYFVASGGHGRRTRWLGEQRRRHHQLGRGPLRPLHDRRSDRATTSRRPGIEARRCGR